MRNLVTTLLLCCSLFAGAKSKKDTLVVPAHVKVIVIDGIFYEVVRTTDIRRADPQPPNPKNHFETPWPDGIRGSGSIVVDTAFWKRNNMTLDENMKAAPMLYNFQVPGTFKSN